MSGQEALDKADVLVMESVTGWAIVVGRHAEANHQVTFRVGHALDFWFHAAACSGSHVIATHPDHPPRCPKEVKVAAAGLALHFSKARAGGRCPVHFCRVGDVTRAPKAPKGRVQLRQFETVMARPASPEQLQPSWTQANRTP